MKDESLQKTIQAYLLQKNIHRAAIFGSYARNEANEHSDIDLLIEADGLTMFDILRMELELEQLTNKKIDMVEYSAIKPSIREQVLASQIRIL
ncbi:nucleotidyltransferase family protein [Nibrella viscosa]|uniref:Nucleotidyltransferase family protein n=1 Tax=Nibrella viscosa TaxID=1084524 RepID=A0ABP8KPW7_9BACT